MPSLVAGNAAASDTELLSDGRRTQIGRQTRDLAASTCGTTLVFPFTLRVRANDPLRTDQDGTLDYDHAVAEAQGIRYDITLDSIAQDSTIFQQREDSDPWEVSCDARACR
jgi:hypothetical protein